MKSSSPEGRYTKISALAALAGLILAYLAWQYPKVSSTSAVNPVEPATDVPHTSGPFAPTSDSSLSSAFETSASSDSRKDSDKHHPHPSPPPIDVRPAGCGAIESATVRVGHPAKVASGLASLSITPGQMGSEPFVTLGIRSDRGSQPQAVLGAPSHYSFATSRGRYFVDVTQVDFATNTLTVEVGCESSGGTAR